MAGWLKLWRKIQDHELWTEPREFSRAEAWIWILMEAQWSDSKLMDGTLVERGSFVTSVRSLSASWRWSKDRVRRFLGALERATQISTQARHGHTLIRVTNYELYQSDEPAPATPTSTPLRENRDASKTHKKKEQQEEEINPSLTLPSHLDTPAVREAIQIWFSYKRQRNENYKEIGRAQFLKKLLRHDAAWICAAIEFSTANGYQGIIWDKASFESTPPRNQSASDITRATLLAALNQPEEI